MGRSSNQSSQSSPLSSVHTYLRHHLDKASRWRRAWLAIRSMLCMFPAASAPAVTSMQCPLHCNLLCPMSSFAARQSTHPLGPKVFIAAAPKRSILLGFKTVTMTPRVAATLPCLSSTGLLLHMDPTPDTVCRPNRIILQVHPSTFFPRTNQRDA